MAKIAFTIAVVFFIFSIIDMAAIIITIFRNKNATEKPATVLTILEIKATMNVFITVIWLIVANVAMFYM